MVESRQQRGGQIEGQLVNGVYKKEQNSWRETGEKGKATGEKNVFLFFFKEKG